MMIQDEDNKTNEFKDRPVLPVTAVVAQRLQSASVEG